MSRLRTISGGKSPALSVTILSIQLSAISHQPSADGRRLLNRHDIRVMRLAATYDLDVRAAVALTGTLGQRLSLALRHVPAVIQGHDVGVACPHVLHQVKR